MPNYKLGVTNRGEGRIIDLSSINNTKKLDELDEFTTSFKNEDALKSFLYNKELIDVSEIKKKLDIYYQNSGKLKHIPVFYQDMKKYLDSAYLSARIKSLCNDTRFLESLANHYDNGSTSFNKQGLNVSDIRRYLGDVRQNGGYLFESKALSEAINDLIIKALFRVDSKTGEAKEDYRGLRDLGLFLYKYELKLEKEKLEKQKKEFEESQLSLFDIIDTPKNTISSSQSKEVDNDDDYEEPIFPPNSEEEAKYLRYLEELEKEAEKNYNVEDHPHYRR